MKRMPIFFLALTLLLVIFSIKAAEPPSIVKRDAPDSAFSAERAYIHLQEIARAPHSLGTAEHERVRQYIKNAFEQMGIHTEDQGTTAFRRNGNRLIAANVSNIIAKIKGTLPGKAILMVAHYDSQPNTPGAGDDGMGVAALLETTRALKSMHPLQHDVVMLISDGEEEGLFGAETFVHESPVFKDIAVVINWDFRGNSGSVLTYETNAENGWIMRQYAKGMVHPLASSMAYEVAKLLPNDADFTPFKKTGITGFTNGAVEGFVNYHSMTDKPENLNLGTMQQEGDNILGMAKHLGNISLDNTKAPDLSYVNLIGYWLIYYPANWNLFITLAVSLMFLIGFIACIRQGKIRPAGFITSFFAIPVLCAITVFLNEWLRRGILHFYPLYTHFYANNAYNSSWYFLTMALLSMILFLIIFGPIYKKWGWLTSFCAILMNMILLMWLSWFYIRSAAFLFSIPCLFLTAGLILIGIPKFKLQPGHLGYESVNFISVLPGLLLFAPFCYLLFITFGLGEQLPFVAIPVIILFALSYPVWVNAFKFPRWVVPVICISVMVFALLLAELFSGFDKQHPLHTNVRYRLNTNDSTADWLSDFPVTDKFSIQFFPDKKIDSSFKDYPRLIHSAPVLFYASPVISILRDTVYDNRRELTLRCAPTRKDVNTMGLIFDDSTHLLHIAVNGKEPESPDQTNGNQTIKYLTLFGVPKAGFDVKLEIKAGSGLGLELMDRSMGLPGIKNLTEYPEDIIPGTDFNCNTVMVRKHFSL